MQRQAVYLAGVMMVIVAAPAFAGISTVPEIDGGSLTTGLGLLAGGLLLLRARRGAKKEN
jgi:hypothetical protein